MSDEITRGAHEYLDVKQAPLIANSGTAKRRSPSARTPPVQALATGRDRRRACTGSCPLRNTVVRTGDPFVWSGGYSSASRQACWLGPDQGRSDRAWSPHDLGVRTPITQLRALWRTLALLGVVVIVTLIFSHEGWAATYYVDQATGNDQNDGLTDATAWATLARAMSVAAGDTVYVKNGTYNAGAGPFNPKNDGTTSAPIAFRAYTPPSGARHRPIITNDISAIGARDRSPGLSVSGRSRQYVIWDGLVLDTGKSVVSYNCTGCIFENLVIRPGPAICQPGNYVGMFIVGARHVTIRHNVISDVSYVPGPGGCADLNASGITLYDSHYTHVHDNEISNAGNGIHDKRNGIGNIYERNRIHHVRLQGILFNSFADPACGTCLVKDNVARHNVIINAYIGVDVATVPRMTSNIQICRNQISKVQIEIQCHHGICRECG